MFNLDPPPGFNGLNQDEPVQWYFRKMPHARQDGATYFVTFRLADSLPRSKLKELEVLRLRFLEENKGSPTKELAEKLAKETLTRIEKWLDQGSGECQLKISECGSVVESAMRFFDGSRYELDCFVVMPNHVHVVVKPLKPKTEPLEKILQSWKRHSATKINKFLKRTGRFWQPESYDRIIRDEEHLYRVVQYIGRNPRLGHLKLGEYILWIRPEWEQLGWGFRVEG